MALFTGAACSIPAKASDIPAPAVDLSPPKQGEISRTAIFAGGCFWCTEAVFEQLDGVTNVVSGYDGDTEDKANYEAVCTGRTLHAEAIQITYDPHKITYGKLLRVLFTAIDPTAKNRQGPDSGPQYRSAIFYATEEEKAVAEAYIKQVNDAKVFGGPIATTIEPVGFGFFPAEAYHQDYSRQNPDQPYIRGVSTPKVEKIKKAFADDLKKAGATTAP